MFTGIIEELGRFKSLNNSECAAVITLECTNILNEMKIGDSIAVNGVCLTVNSFDNNSFSADIMPETLRMTNLGKLKACNPVNLERALKVTDRFGGHIVSGHVDSTGIILEKRIERNAIVMSFKPHSDTLRYIVRKGSVCIDGISLTVTFVNNESFGISLIPLTARLTTLGFKNPGDEVNIECDIVSKYIEKFLSEREASPKSKISESFLKEHGFA